MNIHNAAVQAAAAAAAAQAANIHEAAVRAALSSASAPPVEDMALNAQALNTAAQTHANSIAQMLNFQAPAAAAAGTSTTSTTTTTTTTRNEDGSESTTTTTSTTNDSENPATSSSSTTTPPQQQQAESTRTNQQPESQSIGVEVLAELIQSVMDSYARFLPYLQNYHTMLVNDENEPPESPSSSTSSSTSGAGSNLNVINNNNTNIIVLGGGDNRRQRFCNNINDMMHLLGHLFHNLSDLHINIRDRAPRQMHTMSSMQHSASTIISAAVPIEANIQIPFPQATAPSDSPQSERLAQFRQRHRSSQSLSGDSTTTPTATQAPSIPTSVSSTTAGDSTEATDIPIPLPFTLGQPTTASSQRSSSSDTRTSTNVPQAPPPGAAPRVFRPTLRPVAGQGPVPFQLPPLQYSTLNSYDQFLPCNSVHFYNTINPLLQQTPLTQPASHASQPPGEARWRVNATNRPRARVPAAAFTRFSLNPEETFTQANPTNQSTSQRRRHPAGDQQTSSTNPMFGNIGGGLNQLIGNILNAGLNRPPPTGPAPPENQHIRVNIGGIPGQISISTLGGDPMSGAQSASSSQTPPNLLGNLLQGLTGQPSGNISFTQ